MRIYKKLLDDFSRANKTAREKMATKFGFESAEKYWTYLRSMLNEDSVVDPTYVSPHVRRIPKKKVSVSQEAATDMVIAFDTTGSMREYIGAVRKHVKETIDNLFTNVPNLKLKIVAFGDYCDIPHNEIGFGKAYQETPLTTDKDILTKFVREAQDTGGGDGPEFYELVLNKIISETPWRTDSNKSILLIADDNPHEVGYTLKPWVTNSQHDWRKEAAKAASLNIKIDTLRITPTVRWYAELSQITNGTCMDFKSANKTQNIVEASTYLNSRSKEGIFATRVLYRSAVADGDMELVGAYKGMAADRGINLDE